MQEIGPDWSLLRRICAWNVRSSIFLTSSSKTFTICNEFRCKRLDPTGTYCQEYESAK